MATADGLSVSTPIVSDKDYYPLLCSSLTGLSVNGTDSALKYNNGTLTTTGIVVDTINGKTLDDKSSVKYWGAVGDGITDDTASILLAVANNTKKLFFPEGTYLISDTIAVTNKPGMAVEGTGATILMSADNKPALQLLTSPRASIYGSFTFNASRVLTGASCAIRTQQSDGFVIQGVVIDGGYIQPDPATIRFPTGISLGGNGGGGTSFGLGTLDSVVIKGCQTGIQVGGEYHNISNCQVSYCSLYGVTILTSGNNSINGGQYVSNRIGLLVDSNNSGNGDHGKCVAATFNHNVVCGVFIKRTTYSWVMTNCDVWAQIGDLFNTGFTPDTLVEASAVDAQTLQFGLYCEDVENLNLTGCSISRNRLNMGYDGLVTSIISSNSFLSDSSRTQRHIREFGSGHSAFGFNAQNVITSNNFYANYVAPFNVVPVNIEFLTNDKTIGNVVANNMGTTMVPPYTTAGRHIDANGTYLIDANTQFTTINGARTLTLSMSSSLSGNPIVISFYGVISQVITFNTTSTASPTISGTGVAYNSGTKQFTFTKNGSFIFTPRGGTINEWFIQCPTEAP